MLRTLTVAVLALLAVSTPSRADQPAPPPQAPDAVEPPAAVPGEPTSPAEPVVVAEPPPPTPRTAEAAPRAPLPAVDPGAPAPTRRFGDAGTVAIDTRLEANLSTLGYANSRSSSTGARLEPAFDYFTGHGVSQGASVFVSYDKNTGPSGATTRRLAYGLTVRIGSAYALTSRLSVWPMVGFGVWQARLAYTASPGYTVIVDGQMIPVGQSTNVTETTGFAELWAPLIVHLAEHFFIGAGPVAFVDLFHSAAGSSNRRTSYGVFSTVGGWL